MLFFKLGWEFVFFLNWDSFTMFEFLFCDFVSMTASRAIRKHAKWNKIIQVESKRKRRFSDNNVPHVCLYICLEIGFVWIPIGHIETCWKHRFLSLDKRVMFILSCLSNTNSAWIHGRMRWVVFAKRKSVSLFRWRLDWRPFGCDARNQNLWVGRYESNRNVTRSNQNVHNLLFTGWIRGLMRWTVFAKGKILSSAMTCLTTSLMRGDIKFAPIMSPWRVTKRATSSGESIYSKFRWFTN